jgi:hypothetical protein
MHESKGLFMTPPKNDKIKTGVRSRAVFIRVDTGQSRPLLETRPALELVTTYLFNFRQQGWYDLIGFVALPKELQLLIVPREVNVSTLVERLEEVTAPLLCAILACEAPVWDTVDIYTETVDGHEDIKTRLTAMHGAPVKLRLAVQPASYDFSSANSRFQNDLDKIER